MYTIFLQGLLFGLAYVMPIGMQNIYIINSAMQKNRRIIIFTTAVVIFFDISLAVGCYFGVGVLLDRYVFLREVVMLLGSICFSVQSSYFILLTVYGVPTVILKSQQTVITV